MNAAPFDPMVSIFPSATDADTVADLPLSAVMARIRSDELAPISQHICQAFGAAGGGKAGKRATEAMKRTLPGVTLAGVFGRRATFAWRDASALVQFDLDHLDAEGLAQARRALTDCAWVACLWVSPSGSGLKGAVRIAELSQPDPDRYRMAWRAVTRWLESLGMVNDAAAKDAARLAFLAHDPDAWHNPVAVPFDPAAWAEPAAEFSQQYARAREASGSTIESRALAYVRAMPDSVQGNHGSAAMVAVVRTLRDGFDLSGASLWRVLETWNGEHAEPAWSRAELEHALGSVEREPPKRGRGWLLRSEDRQATSDTTPWPVLEPLGRASDPPPFDCAAMLPCDVPWLLSFVEVVADAVQVPKDLVASAAVGLVSLAGARSVEVACAPEWKEPAPLWVVALLRPGERKSASMAILARPFHEWMAAERQVMAEPVARYLERRRVMEARLSALRTKAAKEMKAEARTRLSRSLPSGISRSVMASSKTLKQTMSVLPCGELQASRSCCSNRPDSLSLRAKERARSRNERVNFPPKSGISSPFLIRQFHCLEDLGRSGTMGERLWR